MCRGMMRAHQFQTSVANDSPDGKMRTKIAQSCILAVGHLTRTVKSVVYAADCVRGSQGAGMASRPPLSLPSTTTITTTTTTTTTTTATTTSNTTNKASLISPSSSLSNTANTTSTVTTSITSAVYNHHQQQQQLIQQQQQQQHYHHKHHHSRHHHHHQQPQQQQQQQQQQPEYIYPRNHHQVHQPHHIDPTTCSSSPGSAGDVSQYYPTRIPLPDGEERLYQGPTGRHNKDKVSEQKRACIKAPPNKSLFDLQYCKLPLTPTSTLALSPGIHVDAPGLPTSMLTTALYRHHHNHHHHYHQQQQHNVAATCATIPQQQQQLPPQLLSPHSPTSPHFPLPPGGVWNSPATSRQHSHKQQHRGDKEGGNSSPPPTRKPKNILNYMATLTSSPKNRKDSNARKSSQQQHSSSSSSCSSISSPSSSSCSNYASNINNNNDNSSTSSILNTYNSVNFKQAPDGRERAYGTRQGGSASYPALTSALPSPTLPDMQKASPPDPVIISLSGTAVSPSPGGLPSPLLCPSGPNSVAEVTLLPCYSSLQQQQCMVRYDQHQYQVPQYLPPQYQQQEEDLLLHPASSPSSPPQYQELSYEHRHSSATPSVPSSPRSPPSTSPVPPSSPLLQQYHHSTRQSDALRKQGAHHHHTARLRSSVSECIAEPVCPPELDDTAADGEKEVDFVAGSQRRPSGSRSLSLAPSDSLLLPCHPPPTYREVLQHPDRYSRVPSDKRNSISSPCSSSLSPSAKSSVPCDSDTLQVVVTRDLPPSDAAAAAACTCGSPTVELDSSLRSVQTYSTDFIQLGPHTTAAIEQQEQTGDLQPAHLRGLQPPQGERASSSSSAVPALCGSSYDKGVI